MNRWTDRLFWDWIAPAMMLVMLLLFVAMAALIAWMITALIFQPCLVLVCP